MSETKMFKCRKCGALHVGEIVDGKMQISIYHKDEQKEEEEEGKDGKQKKKKEGISDLDWLAGD